MADIYLRQTNASKELEKKLMTQIQAGTDSELNEFIWSLGREFAVSESFIEKELRKIMKYRFHKILEIREGFICIKEGVFEVMENA